MNSVWEVQQVYGRSMEPTNTLTNKHHTSAPQGYAGPPPPRACGRDRYHRHQDRQGRVESAPGPRALRWPCPEAAARAAWRYDGHDGHDGHGRFRQV